MGLSREQTLFLVTLVFTVLGCWLAVSSGPTALETKVMPLAESRGEKVETWIPGRVAEGIPALVLTKRGAMVDEPDVIKPEPLDLPYPRLLELAVAMPPPEPRPGWSHLAALRRTLTVVPQEGEETGFEDPPEEPTEDEAVDDEDEIDETAGLAKKEIPEEEWPYLYDALTFTTGEKRWGEIRASVTPERPHGKYSVPLDKLPFVWVFLNPKTGQAIASSEFDKRESVVRIEFAKTVENKAGVLYRDVAANEPARATQLVEAAEAMLAEEWRDEDEIQDALGFAAKFLREALTAMPDDHEIVRRLALCLVRRAEWDLTLELLEDVVQRVTEVPVFLALGKAYEILELPLLAEDAYRRGLEANPTDSSLRRRLADIRFDRGGIGEAGELYSYLIRFDAETDDRVAAYLGTGSIALREGRLDPALASAADAERSSGEPTVDTLSLRAAILFARGEWSQAAEAALEALKLDRGNEPACRTYGIATALAGDFDEARAHFQKALDADPFLYADAAMGLGLVAHLEGNYEASVEQYEIAAAAAPRDPWLQYILGVSYRRDGRLDDALARLRRSLALAPKFEDVVWHLGLLHQARGEWTDATRHFRRAVSLRPENVELIYCLAISILRDESRLEKDRFEEAKGLFEGVLELERDNVLAKNGLGFVTYMLDAEDSDEARSHFERVKNLKQGEPENPDYRYAKQRSEDIQEHEAKVIWVDGFDGDAPKAGWITWPETWVDSRAEDGKLVVSAARQDGTNEALFYRIIEQSGFGELEEVSIELNIPSDADVTVGLFVSKWRIEGGKTRRMLGEIAIGRTFRNELATRKVAPRMKEEEVQWIPVEAEGVKRMWPAGPVRLTIRRSTTQKRGGFYDLFMNGEIIQNDIQVSSLADRSGKIMVGLAARGGTPMVGWSFRAEEVDMVLKR